MTKKIILLMIMVACGILFSQSAYIVDQTNAVRDVYASSAYRVYVDSLGTNPDFALRLCGEGQRYVAATYAANISGSYIFNDLSWNLTTGSSNSLVYTPNALGGPGCYQTPVDSYAFSQFKDDTRTPQVFVSAFPGRIHVLYSNNVDGSSPSFVAVPTSNGWLSGSYAVTRDYNQGIDRVRATVTGINFDSDSGPVSKSSTDPDWGINSSTGRIMVVALCSDSIGDSCTDGAIVTSTSQFPVQLNLHAPVSDQVIYNRDIVVDGLGYPICVGTDIAAAITADPSATYPNQTSNITITLTNNGNVAVTTDFLLHLNITGPAGYVNNTVWTITETLAPGASTTRNLTWQVGSHLGTYTLTARADPTNLIAECDKSNNNATTTVTTTPIYTLHVIIDDNVTQTFPIWGRPYNVTMWITDSDGVNVPNPRYDITEINGLNPFTPTQLWTSGSLTRGLKSYSVGEITGNSSGYIQITMVPTCNLLYTVYSSEGVDTYVGNYSMKVNAYAPGQLLFLYNNTRTYDVPLFVDNYNCVDPGWVNNKDLFNKNRYVLWVYDWLYQVYSNTKKLVIP